MPEPTTSPAPVSTLGRDALRIVLFGMPDAGKSSLLGALAEAAQTQEHLLNGHLTDVGGGLAELHHRLYEDRPRETLEEVVPHAVTFEPFTTRGPGAASERTEAVLVDCDGRVANELLTRRRALAADSRNGNLAQAILEADTLLLLVDASASPSHVDADFAEFGRFLRLLEQSRGRRSDVGGLPVFLVLTKCDLLVRPGDTPAAWIERIEERKRQVDARFQEFLARQKAEGPLPFGRIDLHLWATAVKHPPLADSPVKPREPFGVAELFRQSFALARAFEQRRSRSGRRLFWTVAGGTGLASAMIALLIGLLVSRPQEEPAVEELASKVENYRAREPQTPSSRLREPLQPKISELTEFETDPKFSRLPGDKQQYVRTRLQELKDYRAYEQELRLLPGIDRVRREQELQEYEKSLHVLAIPAAHQPDWNQTDAALYRAQLLEDVKALRRAVAQMEDWYDSLIRRGRDLWTFVGHQPGAPISWTDWHREVQRLLGEADAPPHLPTDRVAGSSLTYDAVLQFGRVAALRNDWQTIRRRLEGVRDLSAALGLPGPLPGHAPLDIPRDFQADQAVGRLQELERLYPRFQQEFNLTELPEAIVAEIRQTARPRYENLIKAGQEVVLRHLKEANPGERESLQAWRRLQPWLSAPEDLKAWRALASVLARLQDPGAEDPISALDSFLRRERFDITLRRLALAIADSAKIRPEGKLLIHHLSGGEKTSLAFEPTGEERHDARRRVMRYGFAPSGESNLSYKPGDTLWADLPVQNGDAPGWMLTWGRNRSQLYQFERLARPPRLHPKDKENTQGEVQEGISLEITPEGGVPKVPDLMPVVPVPLDK
jgi:50S ribosome-binding GTPase